MSPHNSCMRNGVVNSVRDSVRSSESRLIIHVLLSVSDIIHLKMLNTHMIIVNDFKVASELFEKRSALYSDRY
jgi:hypothetical protein